MAYVAVQGGEAAIAASMERLRFERLQDGRSLGVKEAASGLRLLVDQVMAEGSVYDRDLAALALKQAEGSPEEAVFLLRAYRSTLPRLHYSRVARADAMRVERRISAAFKDIPGGQILGSSYDYTHRLLDFGLCTETDQDAQAWIAGFKAASIDQPGGAVAVLSGEVPLPKVSDYLRSQGLLTAVSPDESEPFDVTRNNLEFPAKRSARLQILSRAQTGALTALGYASLRGYGSVHPTVGELRVGMLPLYVQAVTTDGAEASNDPEDDYYLGEIRITEVETIIPVSVKAIDSHESIRLDLGYGLCFGQNETKAIAMSLLDQCLEDPNNAYPTHNEEFVLMHVDSVEATGFISHLKLPHYVTFRSKLDRVRQDVEVEE